MAIILDPDSLNDGTEITVNTSTYKIALVVTGNLSNDGVTLKCVYSKLKELWKSSTTYIKHPFPMTPITDEQFEFKDGWDLSDLTTKQLIRTGGWALKAAGTGATQEEWTGVISLGSVGGETSINAGTHQVYFQQSAALDAVDFELNGPVNQAIQVYGDASHGNFDRRGYLKVFVRTQGWSYGYSDISQIGVTALTYQVYRFPLTNSSDAKITHTDVQIDANADETADVSPYSNMSLTWYGTDQQRTIGASNYQFRVIIDANVSGTGNNPTAEQIYEFVQWSLRRTNAVDIDAGTDTKTGNVTRELVRFVGDSLYTIYDTSDGAVYIDDFNSQDTNRLYFGTDATTNVQFPYTAAGTITFNPNLTTTDAAAIFRMFFSNIFDGAYGTDNAVIVKKADGTTDISSDNIVTSPTPGVQGTYTFDFGYDNNTQADWVASTTYVAGQQYRSPETPPKWYEVDTGYTAGGTFGATDTANSTVIDGPDVVVVALGTKDAQYVSATGAITRSTANSFTLVAPLERNYDNPA
jgi:hypothetical protein